MRSLRGGEARGCILVRALPRRTAYSDFEQGDTAEVLHEGLTTVDVQALDQPVVTAAVLTGIQ